MADVAAPSIRWPEGARCAVAVTVNCDADLLWTRLDRRVAERPKIRTIGEYGPRRGVPRVRAALAARSVRATWFVPASVASRHAAMVEAIAADGHEVACRGVDFEDFAELSADEHRRILEEARAGLQAITGQAPTGFRPFDEVSDLTVPALIDAGFSWSSMTRGDDRPLLLHGRVAQVPLVDLPHQWQNDETAAFLYNYYSPAFPPGQPRIAEYDRVLADWKTEFDGYRELGLCFVFTVDPQSIGTPGRIALLEELLEHMRSAGDVWFATGHEIEQHWRGLGVRDAVPAAEDVRRSMVGAGVPAS